jgi:hypothetical protein
MVLPSKAVLASLPLVQEEWPVCAKVCRAEGLPRSWVAVNDGMFGCLACSKNPQYANAGSTKAFGMFQVTVFHKSRFLRHHRAAVHKNACLALLGLNPSATSYVGPSEASCDTMRTTVRRLLVTP